MIRLRIINAAGDTAYRIGTPGRKLTLTHTDGFPVVHKDVDASSSAWANALTPWSQWRTATPVLMHFRAEFSADFAAFRAAQLAAGLEVVLLEEFLGLQ